MRQPFIAGNWKMYKTMAEAESFAQLFRSYKRKEGVKVAICAPFTDLPVLKRAFSYSGIMTGAQNVHFEDRGAYTGEVSLPMLKELGVECCVVGHSERRAYFGETDETVNKKLLKLLSGSQITPILCVGERLEEREAGRQTEVVAAQIEKDFAGMTEDQAVRTVIAYEPIWAIGTGKTATPDQAEEMCAFIRKKIGELFGQETADQIIIQYGGSVKPANVKEIMAQPDIDGALVGGASLDPEKFLEIVNF